MEFLKRFFDSSAGKIVAGLIVVLSCGAIYVQIRHTFSPPDLAAFRYRPYICAATGKEFDHELVLGETIPVLSPYSGQNTGYPAELCYWNKDGTYRTDHPTYVLLNKWTHTPGPTFCPDCGRLVVYHNPVPGPGKSPPPTREEWERQHPQGSQ